MPVAVVILAAGQGSRMKSDLPKVLHKVAHAPLLVHAMRAAQSIEADRIVVVTGHGGAAVAKAATDYDENALIVTQEEQLGTAHAVKQARDVLADFDGDVVVLYGDTPFIREETLQDILSARQSGAGIVVLGFEAAEPAKYGRLVLNAEGGLERIVEAKDASPEQLAITLCNSGVICADRATMFDLIEAVDNKNKSEEYYLTDLVGLARSKGLPCAAITCPEAETLGVNSRVDLAAAEATFQTRARLEAMENGTTLPAPETVHFAYDTYVGRDVVIEQNVVFGPDVTVESGAHIRAFSHLEGCHVSEAAVIGPYARLRPGAEIGGGAKVGNFVEVKAALVGTGAKINHLSYVGDAEIGQDANIGAGTITCNYDGVFKHKTIIGARAFIGSNTALVAPVTIGDDAMTASGSVVTQDAGDGDLAIARAKQVNKTGLALRLMNKLRAAKAAQSKDK
ncbi:bifunctional UDP-N-acetylglucosamine diphosphorylase/glucosamine-1-phosphate N-acetyltransferase GlmU [Neptunicoccus cionae]|uniref:bifunctional UDP-N-acetylglucosamine diphosphorylase/glucosamine-1-phosphate N-acetyltransferase GlmU n=1 Tax=Neptunicoccus cionae TaxID=2035344 RepID=UPI000C76C2D8|nr:bifunctional UDP-N-acetylglucosamine diphosphorylase/glucosamine-1-phosphate N-acetyltransferase GlmU [Amylibacter cionae]PLS22130.1 bifunctional N-acetylglucosamine-1-phosphate uridyltransferase/glucosamine-1-phosphate acetyltransferase [Amylibacter cionae]